MEKFVKVSKKEGKPYEDIPLNDDGSLSLSILHKYFARAIGLKYYSDTDVSHNIDLNDDRFYPPLGLWGDMIYCCIFSNDESIDLKSESLCIEDIPLSADEYDSSSDANMVHIDTEKTTQPKTRKRTVRPKGKYKKRKPYKCDICDKNFRNKDYVERHKIVHTGEKPFSCTLCEEKFFRQDLLRIHSNKVHNISRTSKLVLTPRSSTAPKRDKRKNDDLYVYAAVKKRKYTRRKGKDGYTTDNEKDKKKKRYECCTCAAQFSKKAELKRHSCNTDTQTQFTCEECRQTFTKLSKLRLHLFKCHADLTPVKPAPTPTKHAPILLAAPKNKGKCKYASRPVKPDPSDVESSDDEIAYWDCLSDSEPPSYVSKCDCVPGFNIVKYIEDKIPPEILAKFKYCKDNNIPWTGFLGYSALYKFWVRIVTDNPLDPLYKEEVVDINAEDVYSETAADFLISEEGDEEEPSEATTENSNFLKGLDDLIEFN